MLVVAWWLSGPAAADGYARQQDDVGTSGADLVLPLALLAAVVAVAAYTFLTRRRRAATRTTPHGGVPVPELAELDGRARAALVAADDAVRTGREDLAAATALAGAGAAQPFAQAVRHAEGELAAAFRLRQELDDARPEDEPARREMLEEVVARSVDAQRRLEEASDVLDALRSAPGSAKEALDAADERCRELAGRLGTAEAALAALRGRYAPSAAAPVATAPDQAGARLRTARERLAQARAAAGRRRPGSCGRPRRHWLRWRCWWTPWTGGRWNWPRRRGGCRGPSRRPRRTSRRRRRCWRTCPRACRGPPPRA